MSLAVLNDEYNEVKIAFGKRLESRERVAASKAAGGLICVDPSGVKSWRNNADDPVLSRETSQPWPSPSA